jgi:hypothetical protein
VNIFCGPNNGENRIFLNSKCSSSFAKNINNIGIQEDDRYFLTKSGQTNENNLGHFCIKSKDVIEPFFKPIFFNINISILIFYY